MAHVHLIRAVAGVLFVGLCGCPPERPPPPPAQHVQPSVSVAPEQNDSALFAPGPGEPRSRRVFSKRFQLSIPLPGRSGWRMNQEHKSSFLVLDHAATSSRLVVRVWRENANMSYDKCEERVRLMRDVPTRSKVLEATALDVPRGFATRVDVGVGASQPGEPIAGYILAFGASARRCFSFVFTTTAQQGGESVVGDRLAIIQGLTLAGIKLKSDLPP